MTPSNDHLLTHPCAYTHTYTDTPASLVEETFNRLVERDDIGIVLINQHVRLSARKRGREGGKGRGGHVPCVMPTIELL